MKRPELVIVMLVVLVVLIVYVFSHRLNQIDRRLDRLEHVTQTRR